MFAAMQGVTDSAIFDRSLAILGESAMAALGKARVLVVGIGGVGGWCAEALVRTGIGAITVIDDDTVSADNINRQCVATIGTVGRMKVEVMSERLAAINPKCRITALAVRYPEPSVSMDGFDVVCDAIDSVDCKAELILAATAAGVPLVSSMGAALRREPTRTKVSRFDRVVGDGLARALRSRFKQLGRFPGRFDAVWSDEPPVKRKVRGSVMPVVAAFGMAMAARAIDLMVNGGTEK